MGFKENKKKEEKLFINQGKDAVKELFSPKWYRQIPNILTSLRGLAPIVILPLAFTGHIIEAIIAECLFATTDFFDGKIARKYNLYSEFGKKLDTICDKIFAITLLIPLYIVMPSIGITIGLEVLISLINSLSIIKGNNPKSSLLGKAKTFLLSISIILGYISILVKGVTELMTLAFAITSIMQVTTAVDYYITDKIKDLKKDKKKIEVNDKDDNSNTNNIIKREEKEEEKEIFYENTFPKDDFKNKTMNLRK